MYPGYVSGSSKISRPFAPQRSDKSKGRDVKKKDYNSVKKVLFLCSDYVVLSL